jgi:hypothetical protein
MGFLPSAESGSQARVLLDFCPFQALRLTATKTDRLKRQKKHDSSELTVNSRFSRVD